MVLKGEGGQHIFEKQGGSLRHVILPVHTKKMEQVISNGRVGLDPFIKTLNKKEKKVTYLQV